MAKPPTIHQFWEQFQAISIPKSAPLIQHMEMKKAFYAGMASMLGALEDFDPSLSKEEGTEVLESYKQELIKALTSFGYGRQN